MVAATGVCLQLVLMILPFLHSVIGADVWYVCVALNAHRRWILASYKRLSAFCFGFCHWRPGVSFTCTSIVLFTHIFHCTRGPMAQLTYWSLQQYDHLPVVRSARKAMCKQMTAMFLEQYDHAIAAISNRISFGYCHV